MMKVSFDEYNYFLPEREKVLIINKSDDSLRLIAKLNEYFCKKKKNACRVVSDDNEKYFVDDFEFIYFPWDSSLDANYNFKTKSLFNDYLTNEIKNNEQWFYSIELLRNNFKELVTDHGMYMLYKVVTNGLDSNLKCTIDNFDISSLLTNLNLEFDNNFLLNQYLGTYNIAMKTNEEILQIIYIDAPITNEIVNWLNIVNDKNKLFILCGDYMSDIPLEHGYFYICNNTSNYILEDIDYNEFINLQYIYNPFVIKNLNFQTEKNMELFHQFDDKNTSFLLKINSTNTQKLQ